MSEFSRGRYIAGGLALGLGVLAGCGGGSGEAARSRALHMSRCPRQAMG